ncbi:hypothetical protein NFJ02_29g68580 [Pycnococcus provasolii]
MANEVLLSSRYQPRGGDSGTCREACSAVIELGAFVIVVLTASIRSSGQSDNHRGAADTSAEAYARATGGEDSSKQTAVSQYHVTDKLVRHLITRLHRDGFTYVVAPFEGSSMVHLVKGGHADYVLTVDSDVASHGVPIVSHTDCRRLEGRWFTYNW